MIFFAEVGNVPIGFDNWLENLVAALTIAALMIHVFKQLMPKPAMEKQLQHLKDSIIGRLDQQDEKADERNRDMREHIDEVERRVHQRVDAHGKELYTLQGYVYGARDAAAGKAVQS